MTLTISFSLNFNLQSGPRSRLFSLPIIQRQLKIGRKQMSRLERLKQQASRLWDDCIEWMAQPLFSWGGAV